MREINNFFREGDEPEMSRDDSANSVVVVKIDGSGFAPEQIINSQMLSGIEALLDTPQIIKEFHSMLHPLTEMIHEHESRGTQWDKIPSKDVVRFKEFSNAPAGLKIPLSDYLMHELGLPFWTLIMSKNPHTHKRTRYLLF